MIFNNPTTVTLVSWNARRMLPKVYAVSTKIIALNDQVVCAVRVFKDRLTATTVIQKLPSASSNLVPMCRREKCGRHSPLFVCSVWRECNAGSCVEMANQNGYIAQLIYRRVYNIYRYCTIYRKKYIKRLFLLRFY